MRTKSAVVLWTGGKDSFLALHIVREENFKIVGLVTFVPVGNPEFRAHPQSEMEQQAKQLGLTVHFLEVSPPYKESYIEKLKWVKAHLGADTAVTGDIDLVGGCSNWIVECCEGAHIEIYRPLWQKPREWIMEQLLSRGIQARISYISHQSIPAEWKDRVLDKDLIGQLKVLCEKTGIDLAGENGEYHTMVIAAPSLLFGPSVL